MGGSIFGSAVKKKKEEKSDIMDCGYIDGKHVVGVLNRKTGKYEQEFEEVLEVKKKKEISKIEIPAKILGYLHNILSSEESKWKNKSNARTQQIQEVKTWLNTQKWNVIQEKKSF